MLRHSIATNAKKPLQSQGYCCETNPRKVKVSSLEEAVEVFGSAITVTVSHISKGWDWVEAAITEANPFQKMSGI